MLLQALQVSLDRILNVLKCLFPGFALRNTAGQRRTFGNKNPVFILLNEYSIPHALHLSLSATDFHQQNLSYFYSTQLAACVHQNVVDQPGRTQQDRHRDKDLAGDSLGRLQRLGIDNADVFDLDRRNLL